MRVVARSFERPAAIALRGCDAEGLALEGLFVPGPQPACDGAVIAPPHPSYGGSMESPVVTELAHACAKAGAASLRFNWRGVGASAGETTGDPAAAEADYASALDFVEESVPGALVACGYSFGAAAALWASRERPRVRRLLLVAPPPALLDREALLAFPGRVWLAAGERDGLAPPAELERLAAELRDGRFVCIPETDHFFLRGLAELSRSAAAWLCGE